MDIINLNENFAKAYGAGGNKPRFFFAPGRVNLIGEHTDYNGGYVFPCALNLGTYVAARARQDDTVMLVSGNITKPFVIQISEIEYNAKFGWVNYPLAVAYELIKLGHTLGGFELYIFGDLPNGAGLSSSASLELAVCAALNAIFSLNVPQLEMVKLCQRAENQFVGVNCGIMDQFASGMCRKDHAALLDCATLEYSHVPLSMGNYKLVIANTNKKRGLTDSKYNERRAECDIALSLLQNAISAKNLCDITPDDFEKNKDVINEAVIVNRAKHAIYENARTIKAAEALKSGDIEVFGKLMNESHISLRDLYEVTGRELDTLAEAAWVAEGVLGSRMTGAGFGGCTVSIVHADAINSFINSVGKAYNEKTGIRADFYTTITDDGAREIKA